MECEKYKDAEERPLDGRIGRWGQWWPGTKFRALGLTFVLAGLVFAAIGCNRSQSATNESNSSASSVSSKAVDTSDVGDVTTEEDALKVYFNGKKLLSAAYFAKNESKAKRYAAEAERCFQKSLQFYVPDIESMASGKKPVHASANWEFLRGLHEAWSTSIGLSGKRLGAKDRIDGNAKDVWALSVISRMVQDEGSAEKRQQLITEKFLEIKHILEHSDRTDEQLSARNRRDQENKRSKADQMAATTGLGKTPAVLPFGKAASGAILAGENSTTSSMKLADGLVAEDPITGRAAYTVKSGTNETKLAAGIVRIPEPDKAPVRVAAAQPVAVEEKDKNSLGGGEKTRTMVDSAKPALGEVKLAAGIVRIPEPDKAPVRVAAAQPVAVEEKDKNSLGGGESRESGSVRQEEKAERGVHVEFRPWSASPGKLYIGNRICTLNASPGKLYLGNRVYTLPPPE